MTGLTRFMTLALAFFIFFGIEIAPSSFQLGPEVAFAQDKKGKGKKQRTKKRSTQLSKDKKKGVLPPSMRGKKRKGHMIARCHMGAAGCTRKNKHEHIRIIMLCPQGSIDCRKTKPHVHSRN